MTINKSSIIGITLIVFLATIFLTALSANVLANDFTVERTNINYRISPDEVAKYNITITNNNDRSMFYSFSLSIGDSLKWSAFPSRIDVPAKSSRTVEFILNPNPSTPVGVYQVNVNVASELSRQSFSLPVHLSYDGLFFDFVPNVETTINLPSELDPRTNTRVVVRIRNRNPLNIENAELRIRSPLFNGEQAINITPGPHLNTQDAIVKEFIFEMNPLQAPGDYEVVAQIYNPRTDSTISQERATVTVQGYSATPTKLEKSRKYLFIITNTITVENFGNRETTTEVMFAAGQIKRLFSTTTPKAEFEKINGETSYVWNPTLQPTEQKTLIVHTNYWPLVIFLIVVALAILLYYQFRSPIVMDKEAAIIDEDVGEGSSDIRIRLFVKNRSGSSVKNITVSDRIRGITEYVESSQLGHVKPTRTTKTTKKGTMLFWDVDELEPFEERIFTYKLKSKLKVVGELTLPKASAKFETKNNRERKILSSPTFFKKLHKKKTKNA